MDFGKGSVTTDRESADRRRYSEVSVVDSPPKHGVGSRLSKYGKRLGRLTKNQVCRGCGRRLPSRSWSMIWSVWIDGKRQWWRFCSDCQDVIYGCDRRRKLDDGDEFLVRDMCVECADYPFCDKIDWMRGSNTGDWYFGDLDIQDGK